MNIPKIISDEISLPLKGVEAALKLLADGATIPFIARYRKEATGGLEDKNLFVISQRNEALAELEKRKETVVAAISEAGKLSPELRERIESLTSASELEDIYLPFRPKKRTRASVARDRGLEPLARILMAQRGDNPASTARRFLSKEVPAIEDALSGASDIIAEWVSESEASRRIVRKAYGHSAVINVSLAKDKDEDTQYADYHQYSGPLRNCPSHRYLAIRRGEAEGILKVALTVDNEETLRRLDKVFVRDNRAEAGRIVADAVADGYKRLLRPSIENEQAAIAKQAADTTAIDIFADNLRQLLMEAPLPSRRVMGIDPGFRTGCKIVCLDAQGQLLYHDVVYPTPPRSDYEGSKMKIIRMVKEYAIEEIAIGNGTASRETERFIRSLDFGKTAPRVHIVSEAGASVYSASEIARREFPDEDVTVRGAVSIGRRLLDPMAELVKIDPKSIGVGQYQHDVDQSRLKASLDHVVESCVNTVGVNLNTASAKLLSYVSGIGPRMAEAIVSYRNANGPFRNRRSLMDVPRLGEKTFIQAAGFLRLPDSDNPLDNTAVHPERYKLVEKIARDARCSVRELIASADIRKRIDLQRYVSAEVGMPTLTDIMSELERPGRDPRGEAQGVEFDESVSDISDLRIGMQLPGIVNNVTAFGAFVDIGVHQSGLVHISELSNRYINHPSEVVKLGQKVSVRVIDVNVARGRISLSMK